jgi:hypothetical protein
VIRVPRKGSDYLRRKCRDRRGPWLKLHVLACHGTFQARSFGAAGSGLCDLGWPGTFALLSKLCL